MTATQMSDKSKSKSLAIKLASVVGLTIFAGFYASSWQRSLNNYYAEQQEKEAEVASAAPAATQEAAAPVAMETTEEARTTEVAPTEIAIEPEAVEVAPAITDAATINSLNGQLYQKIDTTWQQIPSFTENLVYKVNVTEEGAIAQYQHINKAALDYIQETPLPNLNSFASEEIAATPTAEFLVVLAPTGNLQVSPWMAE